MAKVNYSYAKRQQELKKQKKRQEKLQRKLDRKLEKPGEIQVTDDENMEETSLSDDSDTDSK